jgi:SlyX protein
MEERIGKLENIVAFQERMIDELNEALVEQQREIDRIRIRLETLIDRIKRGELIMKQEDELPPPHY